MKKTLITLLFGLTLATVLQQLRPISATLISMKRSNKYKQKNKLVFIDFYTDWCGPCRKMSKEVFPQKQVGDFFNARFVCIKLNAEKEGKALAQQFNIKAYPTFIIADQQGNAKVTITGAFLPMLSSRR